MCALPICFSFSVFFFNDTATTEIYTLSLHDALPISNGIGLRRASYASVWGPNYEERVMIGWLRRIGADLAGMSTGPEAAYLKAVGVRVAGLSCITNLAVEHGAAEVSHEDVVDVGSGSSAEFSSLLLTALPELMVLAEGEK